MMLDLLRHPRMPWLARASLIVVLAAFTYSAFAQYRQNPPRNDLAALVSEIADDEVVTAELPDFESYGDSDTRKEAFFSYLTTFIESENQKIAETRSLLEPMWEVVRLGQPLSDVEYATLLDVAEEYRLDAGELSDLQVMRELMKRVDVIPTSLVLAQAAKESGWGMSRFAREGNNVFGQWCFDEGCGLVPNRRVKDATHEVRAFSSIEASVSAYFQNLNTNRSYQDMREMRAQMRTQGRSLDSMVLARGLTRYSERGMAYVHELQDIIRINRLGALDKS